MASSDLPKNAHVSTHPCLLAKLSQLRSAKTGCREAQTLVHEIALMVGYEALGAGLSVQENGTVRLPLITSSYVNTNPPHPHSLWCEHVLYTELYTTQPAIPPVLYPQHPVTIVP
jgi:uracil phosphoribosyltransferase